MKERMGRNSLVRWLRRFFDTGKQPQHLVLKARSGIKPLAPKEYEHFFRQILEGVEHGWNQVQVSRVLDALYHRSTDAEWVAWLRGFGEQLLASPTPNRELATRLVKFGEIDCGELSRVSQQIGRQLLEQLPPVSSPINEDKETTAETISPIQQVELWFQQGIEQFNAGNFQQAIAHYDKALGILPNAPEVWYNRGNALFQLERMEEAIASYDKALETKPDKQEAWSNRANALFRLERMEEAIASWDKAVEILPTYHQAWYNRAVVLGHIGCLAEAIASYDNVLAIKPDDQQAWFNRGLVLGNLERYEEAIASWDKALEFKPDRYETWYNRGIALSNLGRTEEADASLKQAEVLKPKDQ